MPNYSQSKEHPEDVGVLTLYRLFNFDTPASTENGALSANGTHIGKTPAGSFIHGTDVDIKTAFNAATTNVLTVGSAADDDGLATSAGTASGTPGYKPNLQGAQSGYNSAETQWYIKYTQTGTAATTGVAHIAVRFTPIAFHLVDTSF